MYKRIRLQLLKMLKAQCELAMNESRHPLHNYDPQRAKDELDSQLTAYICGERPLRSGETVLGFWQSHGGEVNSLTFILSVCYLRLMPNVAYSHPFLPYFSLVSRRETLRCSPEFNVRREDRIAAHVPQFKAPYANGRQDHDRADSSQRLVRDGERRI